MEPESLVPFLLSAGVVGALVGAWGGIVVDRQKGWREERWRFDEIRQSTYADVFLKSSEWAVSMDRFRDELVAKKLGSRSERVFAAPELPQELPGLIRQASMLGDKHVKRACDALLSDIVALEDTRKTLLKEGVGGVVTFKDKLDWGWEIGKVTSVDPTLASIFRTSDRIRDFVDAARRDLRTHRR